MRHPQVCLSLVSLVEDANYVAATRLWFEPGALRGHVQLGIRYIQQLVDANRVHAEGCETVLITAADKSLKASAAPNEVDS